MGNNEIKDIIVAAANSCGNLEFSEKFMPAENGKLMRVLSFTGNNIVQDVKSYMYDTQAPNEDQLLKDLISFIRPYLIAGIVTKTFDSNRV